MVAYLDEYFEEPELIDWIFCLIVFFLSILMLSLSFLF
jgi:hypothetical protein